MQYSLGACPSSELDAYNALIRPYASWGGRRRTRGARRMRASVPGERAFSHPHVRQARHRSPQVAGCLDDDEDLLHHGGLAP